MVVELTWDEIKERKPVGWKPTVDGRLQFEFREGDDKTAILKCFKEGCENTRLRFGVVEREKDIVLSINCDICGSLQIGYLS